MNRFSSANWLATASVLLLGCASDPREAAAPTPLSSQMAAKTNAPGAGTTPTDLDGALRQAQAQRSAGDLPAAARTLSQLVLVAPDDARVLGEYGKNLTAQGRSDDALAFLEKAIALKPDWTFYSAQGIAYDQKGIYAAAQAAYDRALALKPGEPSVLSNNALSHMQSGDLVGAEKLLMQAAQSGQPSARIASNLALLRSLKSATPQAPAPVAAPSPRSSSPVPSSPAAAVPATIIPATTPAMTPGKTSTLVPTTTVEKAELPSPPGAKSEVRATGAGLSAGVPVNAAALSSIDRLKSDPGVLMQAVPHDPLAGPVRPKTQTAKAGTKTPGASGGLTGAAALRPALSDWDWRLPSAVHR
jgi:Flp pilus assembly protein TadD